MTSIFGAITNATSERALPQQMAIDLALFDSTYATFSRLTHLDTDVICADPWVFLEM
ncbi:MAG: hypothetical protein KDD42_06390 [Bdellovibrionales bacterium]|nr:hypothetical protein [Bdellovibrionales bacterium]